MSKAKQYEDEADRLMEDGNFEGGLVQLNLAAKEYEQEGNHEKAQECTTMYRLFSGLMHMGAATGLVEIKQALSEFREARRLLRVSEDPNAKDLVLLTEGLVLEAKGLFHLWNGKLLEGIDLIDSAGEKFIVVKDKVPELAEFAEGLRLETLTEVYFLRALLALQQGDLTTYTVNLGESQRALEDLMNLVKDQDLRTFYSGVETLRKAQIALVVAFRHLAEIEVDQARPLLNESSELALRAVRDLADLRNPRAKALREAARGHQAASKAIAIYHFDGIRNLSLGNPHLAKQAFQRVLKETETATRQLAAAGLFGRPLVNMLLLLQSSAKVQVKTISAVVRRSRGKVAISAGTQFALVFFVTLGSFIALKYFGIFVVSLSPVLYVSLVVAAITAFGLNALKLKDLLLPIRIAKQTSETARHSAATGPAAETSRPDRDSP